MCVLVALAVRARAERCLLKPESAQVGKPQRAPGDSAKAWRKLGAQLGVARQPRRRARCRNNSSWPRPLYVHTPLAVLFVAPPPSAGAKALRRRGVPSRRARPDVTSGGGDGGVSVRSAGHVPPGQLASGTVHWTRPEPVGPAQGGPAPVRRAGCGASEGRAAGRCER